MTEHRDTDRASPTQGTGHKINSLEQPDFKKLYAIFKNVPGGPQISKLDLEHSRNKITAASPKIKAAASYEGQVVRLYFRHKNAILCLPKPIRSTYYDWNP